MPTPSRCSRRPSGLYRANVFMHRGPTPGCPASLHNAIHHSCVCMGREHQHGPARRLHVGPADLAYSDDVRDPDLRPSASLTARAAAAANTDMTVIILDNATMAITGGQPTYGSGPASVPRRGAGRRQGAHPDDRAPPKNHAQRQERRYHQGRDRPPWWAAAPVLAGDVEEQRREEELGHETGT